MCVNSPYRADSSVRCGSSSSSSSKILILIIITDKIIIILLLFRIRRPMARSITMKYEVAHVGDALFAFNGFSQDFYQFRSLSLD